MGGGGAVLPEGRQCMQSCLNGGGGGGGVQSTYGYIPKTGGGGGGRQRLPGSSISYAMGGGGSRPKAMLDPGLIEDGVRSTSHHSLVLILEYLDIYGYIMYLFIAYE